MATTTTMSSQRLARTWRDPLGRVGLATRGVLYLVIGLLAIQFAHGDVSSDQVNQTGAFERIAEQPFGKLLIVALILGLVALTAWRLVQAAFGDPVEGDDAKDRIEFLGKALIYAALTVTAVKVAVDNWSSNAATAGSTAAQNAGDQQQQQATSTVFDLPAGRWLVGLFGLVLIGVALYQAYHHAVQASFMERLAPPPRLSTAIEALGRFGYAARSVVFTVSGFFFVVAAVQYDPNESKGMSGSLQELADHSWGRLLLWATAIGLFVFGVFCLTESRYRRHS
jgi:Domain of Unknown Function (DUF1206)